MVRYKEIILYLDYLFLYIYRNRELPKIPTASKCDMENALIVELPDNSSSCYYSNQYYTDLK